MRSIPEASPQKKGLKSFSVQEIFVPSESQLKKYEQVKMCKITLKFSCPEVERDYYTQHVEPNLRRMLTGCSATVSLFSLYSLFLGSWASPRLRIKNWNFAADVVYNISWMINFALGILGGFISLPAWTNSGNFPSNLTDVTCSKVPRRGLFQGYLEWFTVVWVLSIASLSVILGSKWRAVHLVGGDGEDDVNEAIYDEVGLCIALVMCLFYILNCIKIRLVPAFFLLIAVWLVVSLSEVLVGLPTIEKRSATVVVSKGGAIQLTIDLLLIFVLIFAVKYINCSLDRQLFLHVLLSNMKVKYVSETYSVLGRPKCPLSQESFLVLYENHIKATRMLETLKLCGGEFAGEVGEVLKLIHTNGDMLLAMHVQRDVVLSKLTRGAELSVQTVAKYLKGKVTLGRSVVELPLRQAASLDGVSPIKQRVRSFSNPMLRLYAAGGIASAPAGVAVWDTSPFGLALKDMLTRSEPLEILGLAVDARESGEFSEYVLVSVGMILLEPHYASGCLKGSRGAFLNFLRAVASQYHLIPFHNELHASQAAHIADHVLASMNIHRRDSQLLPELDRVSLVVAALCHDVGHRGVGNKLLRVTQDPAGFTYGEKAVVEGLAASTTLKLMNESGEFLLFCKEDRQRARFRFLLVELIVSLNQMSQLQTLDLFLHLSKFHKADSHFASFLRSDRQAGGCSKETSMATFDFESSWEEADRLLFLKAVLLAAEYGHFALPWEHHTKWSLALREEVACQLKLERLNGIATPMLDQEFFAAEQARIAVHVVEPLYHTFLGLAQ